MDSKAHFVSFLLRPAAPGPTAPRRTLCPAHPAPHPRAVTSSTRPARAPQAPQSAPQRRGQKGPLHDSPHPPSPRPPPPPHPTPPLAAPGPCRPISRGQWRRAAPLCRPRGTLHLRSGHALPLSRGTLGLFQAGPGCQPGRQEVTRPTNPTGQPARKPLSGGAAARCQAPPQPRDSYTTCPHPQLKGAVYALNPPPPPPPPRKPHAGQTPPCPQPQPPTTTPSASPHH